MADAKSRKAFENKYDIKRWWINLLHAGYWALECLRIGTLAASPFCFFSWNLNTVHAFILTRCAKNSVHTSISKSRIVSSLWPELQPSGNFFWPRHLLRKVPRSEKVPLGLQIRATGTKNPTFFDVGTKLLAILGNLVLTLPQKKSSLLPYPRRGDGILEVVWRLHDWMFNQGFCCFNFNIGTKFNQTVVDSRF